MSNESNQPDSPNSVPQVSSERAVQSEGRSAGDSPNNAARVLFPVQFREESVSLRTSASNHFDPQPSFALIRRGYGQTDLMRRSSIVFRTDARVNIASEDAWTESWSRPVVVVRRHSSVFLWHRRRSLGRERLPGGLYGDELELNPFQETHSAIVLPTYGSPSLRNVLDNLIAEFEIFRSTNQS